MTADLLMLGNMGMAFFGICMAVIAMRHVPEDATSGRLVIVPLGCAFLHAAGALFSAWYCGAAWVSARGAGSDIFNMQSATSIAVLCFMMPFALSMTLVLARRPASPQAASTNGPA